MNDTEGNICRKLDRNNGITAVHVRNLSIKYVNNRMGSGITPSAVVKI